MRSDELQRLVGEVVDILDGRELYFSTPPSKAEAVIRAVLTQGPTVRLATSMRTMINWLVAYREIMADPMNLGPDSVEVAGMDRKLALAREALAEFDRLEITP